MGIVAKQSILNTLITYLGFAFGALNTLFLFTNILSEENYGVVSYVLASSNLLWPLLAFGLQNTLIKFYHSYTDTKTQSRFFSWILMVPLVMIFIVSGVYTIFYEQIMSHYSGTNPVVKPYVWVIIVIGFASAYFELFYAWAKVHLQSVKGNLLKELFHRLVMAVLLIVVYYKYITPEQFIYGIAIVYIIRALLMKWMAFSIKLPQFSLGKLPNTSSLIKYSILILIAATVAVFLLDLDKVMIEKYLPINNVAVYSICIYMASVIGVPSRAMLQITNPLTAQLLVKKDRIALGELNKKASLTALIVTIWVGLLVVSNMHSIFEMVPSQYILYIEIVLLIGFIKLFDASLGITNSILFNSDNYQWILVFGVAILGIAYYLNTLFIPEYGVVGAAFATFVSYLLYNIAKLLFVYVKFKLQPFTGKTLLMLACVYVFWLVFYYWFIEGVHPIISIAIKGISLSLLYGFFIYFTKLSPEINTTINRVLKIK